LTDGDGTIRFFLRIIAYPVARHAVRRNGRSRGAIDRKQEAHYIGCMTEKLETPDLGQELERLEGQVGFLLDTVDRLLKENRSLRAQQDSLATERANLLEKHDLVRTRVEGIITRLKSMESGA
jgi:cell division protein ZapB